MMTRAGELCRKLRPILGRKIDLLWAAYIGEQDAAGRGDIEQTLEILASRHLNQDFCEDRSPFPPPSREFAGSGDIPLGKVSYAGREVYPFSLRGRRLKEHLLVCGRSGSGKTNLTFILMQGIMAGGVKVLALDWKRGYRDLLQVRRDLKVYTIGRDVSPFRFNPLIPPPGCEPNTWLKLIVDVIAAAYFGGEGVISLLVAGLDKLYRDAGVFDGDPGRWPTVIDLLAWLRGTKLTGRAAMWKASAERILLAMTYGEFGSVLLGQDNTHVRHLLDHNVVLEMDGLSSSSDRRMFSEALMLYLYRYRLARGPVAELTNTVIIEEAHNLLLRKAQESSESVLETSIRMIRQYGLGYVFVDQSASKLSHVAFANSYAMIAMSQKLKGDVQAMAAAMNLSDEQKKALTKLPIGSAVVRLADDHPEPFLVNVPLCAIEEGSIGDADIRQIMGPDSTSSEADTPPGGPGTAIPALPAADKNKQRQQQHPDPSDLSHPPPGRPSAEEPTPPTDPPDLSRETIRFLADVVTKPLSTTVTRYQRLNFSRRRGNAIRKDLLESGLIDTVNIPTRSGQIVLVRLTELGRGVCCRVGIDPGRPPRASLEHRFWVRRAARQWENEGYDVALEHPVTGNGAVDLLAEKHGSRVAIEVETGKSDIRRNLAKVADAGFDEIVLLATSPAAVSACQSAIEAAGSTCRARLMTWLDIS